MVAHYVREHDVPEVDVAAALAVVLQGDEPLLLEPEPSVRRASASTATASDRPDRDGGDRRAERPRARASGAPLATYRIDVGKRHKVEPRQIVGALANEGGLRRERLRPHRRSGPTSPWSSCRPTCRRHAWDAPRRTRISGKLIESAPDEGPYRGRPGGGHGGSGSGHRKGGGYQGKNPR